MRMRRVFATATAAVVGLGAVLASGVMAQAQNETAPPAGSTRPARRAGQRAPREYRPTILRQIETAKIELTPDQKTRIKTLTDKLMADRKALDGKTPAEQRTGTQKLGREFSTAVRALLTPAQQEQLRNARGTTAGRGGNRGGAAATETKPAEKTTP